MLYMCSGTFENLFSSVSLHKAQSFVFSSLPLSFLPPKQESFCADKSSRAFSTTRCSSTHAKTDSPPPPHSANINSKSTVIQISKKLFAFSALSLSSADGVRRFCPFQPLCICATSKHIFRRLSFLLDFRTCVRAGVLIYIADARAFQPPHTLRGADR